MWFDRRPSAGNAASRDPSGFGAQPPLWPAQPSVFPSLCVCVCVFALVREAHHCNVSGFCVLRRILTGRVCASPVASKCAARPGMDHYCPWVNNCVARRGMSCVHIILHSLKLLRISWTVLRFCLLRGPYCVFVCCGRSMSVAAQ